MQYSNHLKQAVPQQCSEFSDASAPVLDYVIEVISNRRVGLIVRLLDVRGFQDRSYGRKPFEVDPARFRRETKLTRFVGRQRIKIISDVVAANEINACEEPSVRSFSLKLELRRQRRLD